MNNPFEDIMTELKDIKLLLQAISMASQPAKEIQIIERPELLKRLNITEPTAIRWGKRGTIPEIRIGANVRYNWPAVVKSLENIEEARYKKRDAIERILNKPILSKTSS